MKERDPLEALREAWRALEPPVSPGAPGADEAGPDPALAWMRAAWDALEPPAARAPRRLARLLGTAAAAALVAGLLAWSLRAPRPSPVPRADAVALLRPTFHDDGSIELRSGVVRLVLIPETER